MRIFSGWWEERYFGLCNTDGLIRCNGNNNKGTQWVETAHSIKPGGADLETKPFPGWSQSCDTQQSYKNLYTCSKSSRGFNPAAPHMLKFDFKGINPKQPGMREKGFFFASCCMRPVKLQLNVFSCSPDILQDIPEAGNLCWVTCILPPLRAVLIVEVGDEGSGPGDGNFR